MFENLTINNNSDHILTVTEVTWEDYVRLSHDDNSGYKISYYRDEISIVYPSKKHERIACTIGNLINSYCRKYEIDYFAFGSADIIKQFIVGKQPDVSYCFMTEKDIPDLAVEVNFTNVNNLEKYILLNVPEIWIWQKDLITFYRLQDGEYICQSTSSNLYNPDSMALDASFLNQYISRALTEDGLTIETDFFNALRL